MLETQLKKDLKLAIKSKNIEKKDAIRMILGETPRLNKKVGEKISDAEIIKIIRSLIKSEMIRLTAANYAPEKSLYLQHLESYLPEMMTEEEINTWIVDNIDFTTYNNNLQAMGTIMKELKGKADGDIVRKLITKNS